MLSDNYRELITQLKKYIPARRLFSDELKTLAYGTDASFYRLTPKIVVKVISEEEIINVIQECNKFEIPITFRASGTSLSGQSISDSVLIVADRSWNGLSISEDKSKITLQPAVLGGKANLELNKFNKKIGPDPASINAVTVTGIASNNASGMTSGVKYNSYNTVSDMRIIFADGTVLDTSDEDSKENFLEVYREFILDLLNISLDLNKDDKLVKRINHKYSIKNTTGYSVNSLVDYQDPIEIIKHLMIGSEGTLGFISEITFKTVQALPNKATSLIIFPNIEAACSAIPILQKMPVDAAEIMDRASLRSVENKNGLPEYLKTLEKDAAALLIETSGNDIHELEENIKTIKRNLLLLDTVFPVEFTSDKKEYMKLWNVRKGLFPSVSKSRKPGTTVVIEDVNFNTSKLAAAVLDLQKLFKKYGYYETIIWGHALSGNIHFVFAQDFNNKKEIERYKKFMNEIVELVIKKYDGSLKAEHGTGRNMAPFVKYEWGNEIYEVMLKIKKLFDPKSLLNPGVLINSDSEVHLKNLKPTPIVNTIIDKCIDCGFCENVCPSKNLTLTPRQRITVWREISKLKSTDKNFARFNKLSKQFDYDGDQTCATDGLCELACPVGIDTGKLVKEIRSTKISYSKRKFAQRMATNFGTVTSIANFSLKTVNVFSKIFGTNVLLKSSDFLHRKSSGKIPLLLKSLPSGSDYKFENSIFNEHKNSVVYFPSCISRSTTTSKNGLYERPQTEIMHKLLEKAQFNVIYPTNQKSLCCGMPFSSKGFSDLAELKAKELEQELLLASDNGKHPIVFDTSPCTKTMKSFLKLKQESKLVIFDSVEFIYKELLERLDITQIVRSIALHPTCSTTKMDQSDMLIEIAKKCVTDVTVPDTITCCGFAGDRGFTHPQLNESALKDLKDAVKEHSCTYGYSSSRTCEIGLSEHSGIDYNSIVYLVDECSEPTFKKD